MITTYDKPFITYHDMIELMRERNIIIEDEAFALSSLSNLSYYGLINGYKNSFLTVPGSDKFIKGIKFEELYTINMLDVSLNNIIFKYILYLERSLKSKISYLVSEKYGVYTDPFDSSCTNQDDYLCRTYYSNSNGKRLNILRSLKGCITNDKDNNIIQHYIKTKNHLPAWILTYNVVFGLMIEWYSILKDNDKIHICNLFIDNNSLSDEKKKEFLRKALLLSKEYRNKIAHGNRTFNIQGLPKLPKQQLLTLSYGVITATEYNSGMGQCDLLSIFLLLIILSNDKYLVGNFYNECNSLFCPYSDKLFNQKTIFEIFNLPNNTMKRIEKLIQTKFI